MARYLVKAQGVAYSASTAQTLLEVQASANKRISLCEMSISFNGTGSTDVPARVQIVRESNGGTSSAFTPRRLDPGEPASLFSAAVTFTGEPTTTESEFDWYIPDTGGLDRQWPDPMERIWVPVSNYLGIIVTTTVSCNVTGWLVLAE